MEYSCAGMPIASANSRLFKLWSSVTILYFCSMISIVVAVFDCQLRGSSSILVWPRSNSETNLQFEMEEQIFYTLTILYEALLLIKLPKQMFCRNWMDFFLYSSKGVAFSISQPTHKFRLGALFNEIIYNLRLFQHFISLGTSHRIILIYNSNSF